MKKLTGLTGILSALLIVPAAVWAFGAWGGHMMDWDNGPGYYGSNGNGNYGLSEEQQGKLADLNRKFYDETQELRSKLWSKTAELNALLAQKNPDPAEVSRLQKEISGLRAQLDEKATQNQLEARKIAPDAPFGGGYGYGPMMGYGYGHMGGYGMGGYYGGGYGPGACGY